MQQGAGRCQLLAHALGETPASSARSHQAEHAQVFFNLPVHVLNPVQARLVDIFFSALRRRHPGVSVSKR